MPPQVPPGTPIQVIGVSVVAETPGPDLAIDLLVGAFPVTFMATLTLSADGEKLEISTDLGFETTIPFGILAGLAGQPILTKVAGTVGSDAAIVLLANLDIQAGDQSDDPLPPGEHLDRGDASFVASICRLATVIYRVDGVDLPLTFDDAMTRADTGALAGRDLSVVTLPADASTTIPDGTLARSVSPSRRDSTRRHGHHGHPFHVRTRSPRC